jgi:hypothetical protein
MITWDTLFFQACNAATLDPIYALRREGDGNRESELEIAYRLAEVFDGGKPTLAHVHSCALQVTLNLGQGITPYANMKRLQDTLRARGFVFQGGRILPPESEPGHADYTS